MTRHKAAHTGLGTPSPLDRWINALLHSLAMLVSHVARRFASRNQISAAECDGGCDRLREASAVLGQHQETQPAAPSSHRSPEALILRTRSATAELVDSKASRSDGRVARGGLTDLAARGTPPLGKGRSDLRHANRGGDH